MKSYALKVKQKDRGLAVKRMRQDQSRSLVWTGRRSQERMFFIAPALVRAAQVKQRALDLNFG
ncbi:MAG TPA: hypothetical protein VJ576_01160 [Rhodocyclaceae bacterium]|nr:hypothetical protein [Rhodocyclaceae bacterium]